MKAREIFRRTRKTLKARLIAFAKSARVRAASARKSLDPVWTRLEPLVQRLAPARVGLGQWTKRKPRHAALVAAVVAVMLLAALGGGARFGRALFDSGRIAPLPADVRRAAHEQAQRLAAGLDAQLDKKRRLARRAGTSARTLIALNEGDPGYANEVSARVVEKFFRSVAGPECLCWRKLPRSQYPNDVGVTAWVLWALATYRVPAHKDEIEFLVASQMGGGAWPQFAGAKQDRYASTFATAAAIVALEAQSRLDANRSEFERMAQAVRRGAAWLQSGAGAGAGRWADYPAWPHAAERRQLPGVSGFALFALHRAGAPGVGTLDREWLRNLPAEVAGVEGGVSGKAVRVGKRSYRDDTRYYDLPWAVLATVLAYPNGSLFDRVRAMRWLERELGPGAAFYDIAADKDSAEAAEMLFALRNYPEIAGP